MFPTLPVPKLAKQLTLSALALLSFASVSHGKNIPVDDPIVPPGVEAEEVPLSTGRANRMARPFSMAPLDLSNDRIPTERELRAAGGLGGALTPIDNADPERVVPLLTRQGKKEEEALKLKERLKKINRSFGEAIVALKTHDFAHTIALYQAHIQEYPDSPWAGEIYLHLGGWAASNGRYTEAEERFQAIAAVTSDDPNSPSYDLAQKVKMTWVGMDIQLGRWNGAIAKLDNILATERNGTRLNWARYMRQQADLSKDSRILQACGAHALAVVLAAFHQNQAADRVGKLQAPREAGFSLAELAALARKNGVPMRGFKAGVADIARLPMPLLVHYELGGKGAAPTCSHCPPTSAGMVAPLPVRKSRFRTGNGKMFRVGASQTVNGHFLIVRRADAIKRTVSIYNPLEKREYRMTYTQFAREWSGTGLALEKPLLVKRPTTVRLLSMADMDKRKGGCCCRPAAQTNLGSGSGANKPIDGPLCNASAGPGGSAMTVGAPFFEMNTANQNLYVYDTPLAYESPIGSGIGVTMHHNRLEGQRLYSIFGAKWSCLWDVALTRTSPSSIIIAMPDGSQQTYTPIVGSTTVFRSTQPDEFTELRFQSNDGSYNLYFPEGGFWRFTKPLGTAEYRLDRVEDIFANWMKINWQAVTLGGLPNVRVASVTEGACDEPNSPRGLIFSYDPNDPNSINPIRISDPYGRSATFTYKAIQLKPRNNLGNDTGDPQEPESFYSAVVLDTVVDMNGWATRYSYTGGSANPYGDLLRVEVAPTLADLAIANNPKVRTWTFSPYSINNGVIQTRADLPALKVFDALGNFEHYYYNAMHNGGGGGTHIPKDGVATGAQVTYAFVEAGQQTRIASVTEPATALQPNAAITTSFSYNGNNTGPFLTESSYYNTDTQSNVGTRTTLHPTYGIYGMPSQVAWDVPNSSDNSASQTYAYGMFVDTTRAAKFPDLTQVTDGYNRVVAKIYWNAAHQPTEIFYGPTAYDGNGIPTNYLSRVYTNYAPWGGANWQVVSGPNGANLRSTYWNYDPLHRLLSITADGVAGSANAKILAEYAYDSAVPYRVFSIKNEIGQLTRYYYDNFDRVKTVGYFDGSQEDYEYCSICGALLKYTGRDRQTTTYVPDAMGRTIEIDYPDGRTVKMGYSPEGRLRALVDQANRTTTWTYDEMGRLYSKKTPNNYTRRYQWNQGNVVLESLPFVQNSTTPNPSRYIRYNYSLDHLVSVDAVGADGSTSLIPGQSYYRFLYDRNGRSSSSANGLFDTTYDVLGRVVAEDQQLTGTTGDESAVVRTSYNGAGEVSGMSLTSRSGALRDGYTHTYSYDTLSRSVNNTSPIGTFISSYDPNTRSSLPSSITWPGNAGRVEYAYDGFQRVGGTDYKRSDGTSSYFQMSTNYDLGSVTNFIRKARDVRTIMVRYVRDPGDVMDSGQNVAYQYEPNADRLIAEYGSANSKPSNRFEYDDADNRKSVWFPLENQRINYVIGSSNEITLARTYPTDASGNATSTTPLLQESYFYDERGNLTKIAPTGASTAYRVTYEYDYINRLTAVTNYVQSTDATKPGPKPVERVEFTYDQQDRRAKTKTLEGEPSWYADYNAELGGYGSPYWHSNWTLSKTTRTIYAGMQPIQERNELNQTQVQLYYGDDGMMGRRVKDGTGWRTYFITNDHYGNVTQLIRGDTQQVVVRYNYDAYGNLTEKKEAPSTYDQIDREQVNQPYRYQGHYYDETSRLYDFGYRFYSSGTGRFLNQDPLEEDGGINLYGYVGGNPTNAFDPDGLQCQNSNKNKGPRSQDPGYGGYGGGGGAFMGGRSGPSSGGGRPPVAQIARGQLPPKVQPLQVSPQRAMIENVRILRGWARSKGWIRKPGQTANEPETWGVKDSNGNFSWRLKMKTQPAQASGLRSNSYSPRFEARLNSQPNVPNEWINPFTGLRGTRSNGGGSISHSPLDIPWTR